MIDGRSRENGDEASLGISIIEVPSMELWAIEDQAY
jgi:hypothetical protein